MKMGKSEDESADGLCNQVGMRSSLSVEKLDMNDIHLRNPEEPLRKMNALKDPNVDKRVITASLLESMIIIINNLGCLSAKKEALSREVA